MTEEQLDSLIADNSSCLHRNKYNNLQRRSFYPFNKTGKISLISFRDTTSTYMSQLPVKNGILDIRMVKEEIQLSDEDIDKLTDLFYNYGYKSKKLTLIQDPNGCYRPHNAILFFDDKRNVIAYIEICFDCIALRFSSKKISIGESCLEKFSLLKDLFASIGIKYLSLYK